MTVPASLNLKAGPFEGDGTQTDFYYTFPTTEPGQVEVWFRDASGDITLLSEWSDYTLDESLGKVSLFTPLDYGEELVIASDYQYEQTTDLTSQGRFFPQIHEDAFDYVTLLIKQLLRIINSFVVGSNNPFEGVIIKAKNIIFNGESLDQFLEQYKTLIQNYVQQAHDYLEQMKNFSSPQVVTLTQDMTLSESDNFTIFRCNSSSQITITLPLGIEDGINASFVNVGSGPVVFTTPGRLVIPPPFVGELRVQGSSAAVTSLVPSTGEWMVQGDLKDTLP